MSTDTQNTRNMPTRRDMLKKGGLLAAAVGASAVLPGLARRSSAADRGYISIGHPNPSTGAISQFGEVSPWADISALSAVNEAGGIYIKEAGKRLPVKLRLVDTQSDPKRAAQVALDLIEDGDGVDMMVVHHTPDTVNPVSRVCETKQVPCVSTVVPLEAWLVGGPYEWCFHSFWSVDSLSDLFLGMWNLYADRTTRVFGGLWPDDPDGRVWAEIFTKKLTENDYVVVDPGRLNFWTPDFTDIIRQFMDEQVEIIGGVIIPPDWINFWRQARQDGFFPKMAAISKAIPFPSAVNELEGNSAYGLISELWWSPDHPYRSRLTQQTARDLCATWEQERKKQWTMPLGFAYAGIEIAVDALKRAQSIDRFALREALAKTDLETVIGHVRFRDDHTCETPLVGGQWVPGQRWPWDLQICYNKPHPEIPAPAEMVFPLPKPENEQG